MAPPPLQAELKVELNYLTELGWTISDCRDSALIVYLGGMHSRKRDCISYVEGK